MTVKELIEELQKYPEDMEVMDNKFEIGEECFTIYKRLDPNTNRALLDICKIRIKRIVPITWLKHRAVRYEVERVMSDGGFDELKGLSSYRVERIVFKTREEAEEHLRNLGD